MKPRDAAFMVDHRRQLSGASAASPVRKDEEKAKKKRQVKASAFQQQQPAYKPPKPSPSLPAAQLPSKSARKNAKKKENKAKLAAQSLQDPADLLHQDSVKSRNHKLVLAPATSATASSSSFCVSSNFPSWGAKKKKQEQAKPTLMAMNANRAVTDALHEEILEYTKYTKKTVEKMAVHIEEMIANVRACVQSLWPQSKVEAFGSYSTGIWLPSSDVDLVILDVVEVNDSKLTAKHLRELANVLEKKKWVESLLCLDTAKVPVLKLVSAETSVPIDITFESAATHSGLLARDLIKRYADNMPELYPLAIVFKQLLRERDLNDAYTGGLSSYSVVLMIIHFSQLWRNGDSCFEAASIYASGSLPPAPSRMQAQKAARIQAEANGTNRAGSEGNAMEVPSSKVQSSTGAKIALKKSASLPLPAPTSSYAAIVTKKQATDDSSPSEPRFSYAAVAAGIAKVSEKKPVGPPSSYAAAVSAPAGSSSSATKRKSVTTTKKQNQDGHTLDSISVSSSNADTEDSSSSCSHSSSTDSDDETQPQQPPVSLGQHLLMILEFFGIIFDYRKNGLSVRDGGYIYRLADSHRTHIGKPALVIEDPIHPDRNVSASSFAFSKVVALFEDSYYALKYFRATKFTPSALSCLLSTSGHTSHTNHIHSKVQTVRS